MLNGVIYKLKCKDSNITEFYIGSSCNMKKRIEYHKSSCNNTSAKEYNYKVYKFIRDNNGFDNFEFEILLEVEVESREELRLKYERKYQLELLPQLNVRVEGRTIKEYKEDNKETIFKKQKQWREDNKEEIAKYQKEYKEDNKETIFKKQKQWREDNKEKITIWKKEWYEDNREEILKKSKEYNEKHKEEIAKKVREKFKCECGGKYTYPNKLRHLKSKKHKKYISSLKTNSVED